jgi:hypothetical protein
MVGDREKFYLWHPSPPRPGVVYIYNTDVIRSQEERPRAHGFRKPARTIRIRDWDFDDANVAELAAHGVTVEIVDDVVQNRPRFRRNKKRRRATHQMIGPDGGGRFWVICLLETGPATWRPITGWAAGEHEIGWWRTSQ